MTRRTQITAAAGCMMLIAVVAYQIQAQSPSFQPQADPRYISSDAKRSIASKAPAAIKQYKAAKSGEERTAAEKELRAALAAGFDLLMQEREAHLADLKARLERLTAQLQKRRDAKGEIVDLRLKVLINEANGLGFFPDSNQTPFRRNTGSTSSSGVVRQSTN